MLIALFLDSFSGKGYSIQKIRWRRLFLKLRTEAGGRGEQSNRYLGDWGLNNQFVICNPPYDWLMHGVKKCI